LPEYFLIIFGILKNLAHTNVFFCFFFVEDYLTSDVIGVKVKEPIELAKRSRNAITAEELEAVSRLEGSHIIDQTAVLSYILYNRVSKESDGEKFIKDFLNKEKDLLIRGKREK